MESNFKKQDHINNDAEINFFELFSVLWNGKWLISSFTLIFSVAAIIYSLSLPNIYQSTTLLSPVSGSGGMSQAMDGYKGIASLAGINLSSKSSGGNSVKAIEKLQTLSFFEENILPNIFLPDLMALESWNLSSNTLVYNKDKYDDKTNLWVGKSSQNKPSSQESFIAFKKNHLTFSENQNTGFVTIRVNHKSPHIAQEWLYVIVNELNNFYRSKDKLEAEASMAYLNSQMLRTSFSEIKQVIAALLQQKMQQLTLIEASDYYVFDYIDPPAALEKKVEPRRSMICILGFIVGVIIGMFIVLIRHFGLNRN
jgi:LPS O-antigen subunit length determinant protein (WzzB/FepE family)